MFLKGCSLRCIWCSNPESLSCPVQIGVYPDRCIGTDKCGACFEAAPDAGAFVVHDGRVVGFTAAPRITCAVPKPARPVR